MNSYFKKSKSNTYGLFFVLPLLIIYELCIFASSYSSLYETRNGAEIFVKNILQFIFESSGQTAYSILLALTLIFLIFFNRKSLKREPIKGSYFFLMFIESFVMSIALLLIMAFSKVILLSIIRSDIFFEEIYLSIGAGIWEEIIFRLFFLSSILLFTTKILNFSKLISIVFSIGVSSIAFSCFHHLGSYGEIFNFDIFTVRSIAGIFLGAIYLIRGIGISVYTHTLYDIMVVLLAFDNA